MKTINSTAWLLFFFLCFFFTSHTYAQFEDEFLDDTEENDCIPASLMTPYDSVEYADPDQPIPLLYNFGYEYYKNKSYKEALPYLWRVFIEDSTRYSRNAVRFIARMYFDQGIVDSTLIICYRGLEKFNNIITLHYYAGILQNKMGRSKCAIPHYEAQILENESEFEKKSDDQIFLTSYTENLRTLAFLYYKTNDEKAIELQQRVVELNPTDAEASNTLAQYSDYFFGKGAGLDAYRQAYLNDPTNLDLALKYGEAAAQSDTVEHALKPLSDVISEAPSRRAYVLRAGVYENLGRYRNAIEDYKQGLNLSPNDADLMLKIAVDYRLIDDFSSAQFWVNRALRAQPGNGLAFINMGEIYEAAVSYCLKQKGSRTTYEDKLVYELAYNEYKKAQNDPAFRSRARTKISYVEPLIPTTEDRFMNKGKKIESDCYSWIK
jgi:tetratricopeptide (TPR) repeat protein